MRQRFEFDFTIDREIVCPHCRSGWVIISVGVLNGLVTRAVFCSTTEAQQELYCPFCGKDMRVDSILTQENT